MCWLCFLLPVFLRTSDRIRALLLWTLFETHLILISLPQGCFIFSLAKYKPLTYNKVYTYPEWAIGLGWVLALSSMICIPMVMVIRIIRSDGSLIEVRETTTPLKSETALHTREWIQSWAAFEALDRFFALDFCFEQCALTLKHILWKREVAWGSPHFLLKEGALLVGKIGHNMLLFLTSLISWTITWPNTQPFCTVCIEEEGSFKLLCSTQNEHNVWKPATLSR